MTSRETLLVALGGNALIKPGQTGTAEEQLRNLRLPARQLAQLAQDYRLLITHGNGPQVGNLLLQQESCSAVPKMPLEILVAQTQGQIGYMLESVLDSELTALGHGADQPLATLLSYVVVDPADPAFAAPTKPIGPSYPQQPDVPYPLVKTAHGYRRVVASPQPITIVERREIARLLDNGFIVICCGGGGIPVIRSGRDFHGVDAVIDKDLASARLAQEVGVQRFVIATDVPGVALNFGQKDQCWLPRLSIADAQRYLTQGVFAPGSMAPKVEAAVRFLRAGGSQAVITSVETIAAAVAGTAGTVIVREDASAPGRG